MIDWYFPPHDGLPRHRFKSHEILWCIAQGYPTRVIRQLVGVKAKYISKVKHRYKKRDPAKALTALDGVCKLWGDVNAG